MSDQADQANAFARAVAGGQVDPKSAGLSAPPATDEKREALRVRLPAEGWQLSATAREIGAVLKTNGVFRRGDKVVTVGRDDEGQLCFQEMGAQRLRTYVERYMVTGKWRNGGEGEGPVFKATTMSPEVAQGVLRDDSFLEQQRPLRRINDAPLPVWRADGRIELLQPGYDREARIMTVDNGVVVRDDQPLEEAVCFLTSLHEEFPLSERKADGKCRSLAVSIAGMLSLFGVGLLGPLTTRMHFCYTANSQRSGKSLLAKLAIVPVSGPARVCTKPDSPEELRKELSSVAINGRSYFFLDDLEGMLKSQELNAFMTSAVVGGRMLGGMTDFSAAKQCVVFITGNNLALSTDIANRTLRCSLYTEEFDVQSRHVKRTIDEEWLCRPAVRGDILTALWTLVKAWDKAGRPKGTRVLKGFERWCEVFGGIVAHAGFGDPCEAPPLDDTSGDTDAADMRTLVEVLVADMEERPASVEGPWSPSTRKEFHFQDLVDACMENSCFEWHMEGVLRKEKNTDREWLELNNKSKSWLGKQWSGTAGGRIFRLKDGRSVRFGSRGRNRHKRYMVEIVPDSGK